MRARRCRPLSLVVGFLVGYVVMLGAARASDYTKVYAEGLRHSRRAAALAGANNCTAAIPEYTKAIKLLKDPVLLFNRAECYRTLGQTDAALADYRHFLTELPGAPNRARVEAHIAALERPEKPTPAPVAAASPAAVAAPALPPPRSDAPVVPIAPATQPSREIITQLDDTRRDPQPAPPPIDVVHADPAPMPLAPADVESRHSVTSRWWMWTIAAVLLAAGGVTTYLLLRSNKTDEPSTDLGNYRF